MISGEKGTNTVEGWSSLTQPHITQTAHENKNPGPKQQLVSYKIIAPNEKYLSDFTILKDFFIQRSVLHV